MNTTGKLFRLFFMVVLLFSVIPIHTAHAAALIVTNTNDSGVGSLRQAINDAAAGATITFDSSLSGQTITLDDVLILSKNLTIDGSALASPISISANTYMRVFQIYSGRTIILDSLIITKSTPGFGGGIRNWGILTVNNCTFSGNSANSGGGIDSWGTLTVDNSAFSNNLATERGGGINNDGGNLTVNNSTFSNNLATNNGGGIFNWGLMTLNNSTFFNNSTENDGGGIYSSNGTLTVHNSTFSGNSAKYYGGGIYNLWGTLSYSNTILANSLSGDDCYNNGGTIGANSNNLVETRFNCGTPAITTDPALASLADNGGRTRTMALLPGSAAINAGNNAACTSTDQRGVTRPLGGTCDIGAYESGASILTVSSSMPAENATLSNLTSLAVNFSEDALHDGTDRAANYAGNYLLVERGANGTFDTLSCAEGLQSDDTAITINAVSYDNSTFISTLTMANELPNGSYRLFVCGTTSIWSAAGLELNNGDNDMLINFSIINPAVLADSSTLPGTGFSMAMKTDLPAQPASKAYSSSEMTLEIPALKITTNIVGVPFIEDTWDVSWLGSSAGWLEGSAFPTWAGNTVITGHVWGADNQPGVFVDLKALRYGDQLTIQAWGHTYTYEVRQNKLVTSKNTKAVLQHEELDWITLVTCEGYDPAAQTYSFRRMVRAVLVQVE